MLKFALLALLLDHHGHYSAIKLATGLTYDQCQALEGATKETWDGQSPHQLVALKCKKSVEI